MDIAPYKKHIAIGMIVFAIVCIILCIGSPKKENPEEEEPIENVPHDVADGEVTDMTDSKSEAYDRGDPYQDPDTLDMYGDNSGYRIWVQAVKDSIKAAVSSHGSKPVTQEQLFGEAGGATHSPAPQRAAPSNPYRETPAEREARHQRRHDEALELAERIQREAGGDGSEEYCDTPETEQTIPLPPSQVKRSDVISSLDGWDGSGMSSLDDSESIPDEDQYTPFRCMFARESKLTDGQRVTVILLDDLNVSGVSVPRNTHLMATCQITNRLELEFVNIEIGGRILPLGYEAYDVDGSKGIYCPDAGSAGKTVKGRGADILSSTLSSRLGRVARDVATTGISLVQSADGQRTVSVPAGYTFFIVKKKQY